MSPIKKILLTPIYIVSFVFPRDKKLWLFGDTQQRFADNSKYFYLYVHHNQNQIKAIWLSRNKEIVDLLKSNNLNAIYTFSLKGIFYGLRAKVYVHNSMPTAINFWTSGGAYTVNLWHAIQLKKVGYDALRFNKSTNLFSSYYNYALRYLAKKISSNFNLLLVTNKFLAPQMQQAFRCNENKLVFAEYPRNEVIFKDFSGSMLGEEKELLAKFENLDLTHVLYAPTFRDSGKHPLSSSVWDLKKLDDFCKSKNAIFWMKFHVLESNTLNKPDLTKYSNIKEVNPAADVYPLLKHVDMMITDYSSIYIDYLLLNRPVAFFAYDLEEYKTTDRSMYYDYTKITPGPIAESQDSLIATMQYYIEGNDSYSEQRKKVASMFHQENRNSSNMNTIFTRIVKDINLSN